MLKIRPFATCAALIAAVASAMAAGRAFAAEDREQKLISVLRSDAPPQTKAIPCKQLAIYGTKAAVPALAALLSDKDLASWARIALEAIPGPACDDALREAMGKLEGRLLIGTINSIGVRRDPKAVAALIAKLKDADAAVACAAAAALGRIGGEQAVKALEQSLAGAQAAVRSAAAEGCVRCAERLAAARKPDQAVKLYDAVRKADVPRQRRLEAIRGTILARGAAGVPLLIEQLRSADKAHFGIGLRTARELPGPEATAGLVAELGRMAPTRQVLLLFALADRGDAKALPAVVAAAKSGPKAVRLAAMAALERFGDASCVPVLLDAALEADAELAGKAKATLAKLPGKDVDADVVARLPQASGKQCEILIGLAGQRRIEAALPAIVPLAAKADAGVRRAAVATIGALGEGQHVAELVKVLERTEDPGEQAGIRKALMAIGAREGADCVKHLMPLTRSAKSALRAIGFRALASAGGPEALAAVSAALDDKDETVRDAVVRTLSTWPNNWPEDLAVMAPLLALARSSKKAPHQILALRGYLQCVGGTSKLKADAKLAKVKDVLPLIARRDEKRLVISVLGAIRTGGALEILTTFVADRATAEEACSAIVGLAGRRELRGVPKELRRKALQAAAETSKSGRTRKRARDLLKAVR